MLKYIVPSRAKRKLYLYWQQYIFFSHYLMLCQMCYPRALWYGMSAVDSLAGGQVVLLRVFPGYTAFCVQLCEISWVSKLRLPGSVCENKQRKETEYCLDASVLHWMDETALCWELSTWPASHTPVLFTQVMFEHFVPPVLGQTFDICVWKP